MATRRVEFCAAGDSAFRGLRPQRRLPESQALPLNGHQNSQDSLDQLRTGLYLLLTLALVASIVGLLGCDNGKPESSAPIEDATPERTDVGAGDLGPSEDGTPDAGDANIQDTQQEVPDAVTTQDSLAADSSFPRDLGPILCNECPGGGPAIFEDPAFETAARQAAEVADDCLFCPELALGVKRISAELKSISSIAGIEIFTNLESVAFPGNDITDIGPLGALRSLKAIQLDGNPLASIQGLEESTEILTFLAPDCPIEDLHFLAGNRSLQTLEIRGSPITDLAWIEGLQELTTVGVGVSLLDTTRGISHLPKLYHLWIGGNRLTSLDGLVDLPSLESLNAIDNQIVDIDTLADLPALRNVQLDRNRISDLSPIVERDWPPHAWLSIRGNPIDCQEQAANLEALRAKLSMFDSDCH